MSELHDLAEALERLPEEQRQAVLLVRYEGLADREAADVLDIPIGTVMSRLSRGREALRRMMNVAHGQSSEGAMTRSRLHDANPGNDNAVAEDDLQAYVDGQLDGRRRAAIESYLAAHPGEAARLAAYRAQNIGLHALFDPPPGRSEEHTSELQSLMRISYDAFCMNK